MIEENDLGLGKIQDVLEDLKSMSVTFGYQGPSGAAHHPGTEDSSVADVAAWQEFGTPTAPARPLGRATLERAADAFGDEQRKALADVIDGRESKALQVALPIGILAVRELRKTIDMSRDWAVENADSTILKKGHDQPLVGEYGMLYEAASYAIRVDGKIVAQGDGA